MKRFLEHYNGQDYFLYTISNRNFKLSVTDYGATICNFEYRGIDIVQGFENVSSYANEVKYMNAAIGRVCNRIEKGEFTLNNQKYHLAINNGPNCLHGGLKGFDCQKWILEIVDNTIICKYHSPDNEEGFPGNLDIEIRYELLEDGLSFSYNATSDKDTLCSICNHAFFNLNGADSTSILEDNLMINSDEIAMVDKDGLTHNEKLDVTNTPFDFRSRKKIGLNINDNHSQIINANGYDHHYIIKGEGLRHFLTYDNHHLSMEVYSDMPGVHVYSGNFLEGIAHGKLGNNYPPRSAICFETQYYPNAINCNLSEAPILKANSYQKHTTIFKIKEI